MKENEWTDEFDKFMNTSPEQPPLHLSQAVKNSVYESLAPSKTWVIAKLFLLHAFSVSLTLVYCPQFGINPLNVKGLMSLYMHLGEYGCMIACGATVIGLSIFLAVLVLQQEELRILKKLEYWVIPGMAFTALGIFGSYGELLMWEMLVLWAVGAIVGGKAVLEGATYVMRQRESGFSSTE